MSTRQALAAEALGSMLLATAVIGSGIMADRLSGGNAAIALLANTAATMAALSVLIASLGPVSGAHFNPVLTLVQALERMTPPPIACGYAFMQVAGCCAGALLAHAMFGLPLLQASTQARTGLGQWLSEGVATAGLTAVVATAPSIAAAAWRVPAWIGAAYWFTASTSFANPAITLARSLSDTFSGVRPVDAPPFIAAQLAGAVFAMVAVRLLHDPRPTT